MSLLNTRSEFSAAQNQVLQELFAQLPPERQQEVQTTVDILTDEVGLGKTAVAAVVMRGEDPDKVKALFDEQVASLTEGLHRIDDLYRLGASRQDDNYRKLLMALAEDIRVVIIIIAERAALMRRLNGGDDTPYRREVAKEPSVLYAPVAHRLGLYAIKTELEDLSLKFSNYTIYKEKTYA